MTECTVVEVFLYIGLAVAWIVGTVWAARYLRAGSTYSPPNIEPGDRWGREPVDPFLTGCAARFSLPAAVIVLLIVIYTLCGNRRW